MNFVSILKKKQLLPTYLHVIVTLARMFSKIYVTHKHIHTRRTAKSREVLTRWNVLLTSIMDERNWRQMSFPLLQTSQFPFVAAQFHPHPWAFWKHAQIIKSLSINEFFLRDHKINLWGGDVIITGVTDLWVQSSFIKQITAARSRFILLEVRPTRMLPICINAKQCSNWWVS